LSGKSPQNSYYFIHLKPHSQDLAEGEQNYTWIFRRQIV
jgi:hypothetical protein